MGEMWGMHLLNAPELAGYLVILPYKYTAWNQYASFAVLSFLVYILV